RLRKKNSILCPGIVDHYSKAKHDYEVAHLKRWSQRTDDYWSLKDSAKNQHEIVEVYRSQIGKNLADQWFLPLTT
ncbi:hypothetical protein, partial [Pseudomonas lundensis]|uniref:hypothetical protein n=1 Tax=Pseudomonas lundensis TaxID=86185 RepID=UPI003F9E1E87